MTLAQEPCAAKSNEITAIPRLLGRLVLEGAVVTIDAAGCHRAIVQKLRAARTLACRVGWLRFRGCLEMPPGELLALHAAHLRAPSHSTRPPHGTPTLRHQCAAVGQKRSAAGPPQTQGCPQAG